MDSDEDNYLEAAQRTAKQKYLREEIIEMDYSTDEFVSFMDSRGGADINYWSFDELQEIVKEFKQTHRTYTPEELEKLYQAEEQSQVEEEQQEEEEQPEQVIKQEPEQFYTRQYTRQKTNLFKNTPSEIKRQLTRTSDQEQGIRSPIHQSRPNPPLSIESFDAMQIKVCPLQPNELSDGKAIVSISQPQLVSGGFFSSKEVQFLIQTRPVGWSVQRKESQIQWLQNALNSQYQGQVPTPRLSRKIKLIDQTIQYKITYLERWFQGIMRNEVLRSSPEVYQFLSQTDNKTFENFKSKSEKRPIPDVYNLSSPDGKIKLDPNLMTDEFYMHDGFMKKSEGLKKQLTMLTRKLASVLHSAEQIFQNLMDTTTQLQQLHQDVDNGNTQIEMLENIKNIYYTWSQYEKQQADFLEENVAPFYKYQQREAESYNRLVSNWQDKRAYYERVYQRLTMKKEKLWDRGNIQKWELSREDQNSDIGSLLTDKELAFEKMCHKETQEIQAVFDEIQYYNYQIVNEAQRIYTDNMALDALLYLDIAKKMGPGQSDLQDKWQGFSDILEKLLSHNIPHRDFLDQLNFGKMPS